jgi:hypothetical protein
MTLDNTITENSIATIESQASVIPMYDSPAALMQIASEWAKILMDAVSLQEMAVKIQNKQYLEVEAWQLVGLFANAHAVAEKPTEKLDDQNNVVAYECVAHVYQGDQLVSKGTSICGVKAFVTQGKFGYDINRSAMSAAQTWAISKAYRNRFAFVAKLAGFEGTTADEMREDHDKEKEQDSQTTNRTSNNTPRQPANPGAQKEGWVLTPCEIHPDEVWRFTGSMPSPAHTIRDAQGKDIKGRNGNSIWCNLNKWTESNISVLAARNDAIQAQLDGEELSEWRDKWVTLEPWRKYGAIIEAETRMRNAPTPALEGEIVDELACPHYQVDNGICAWCQERVD